MINENKLKSETKAGTYVSDKPDEFNVGYFPIKAGTYKIEIDSTIEHVSQFSTAIQALGMATEEDDVEIHLQSGGGSLDATDAMLHAMRKCKAPIHCVATGNCSSAATAILLECGSFELSDSFNSLIHCGSLGSGGNFNEYNAATKFNQEFMPNWIRKTYEGFLTTTEIEDILKGQDIWLDARAFAERFQMRNEHMQKKMEGLLKQQKKAVAKARREAKVDKL